MVILYLNVKYQKKISNILFILNLIQTNYILIISFESFFGRISHLNLKLIKTCLDSDQLPIINTIGENYESNKYLYLEINNITYWLALNLIPFKIIKLNKNGGLKDENKKVIQLIKNDS